MSELKDWCPTIVGTTLAYQAEWWDEEKKEWRSVPCIDGIAAITEGGPLLGAPYPRRTGDLLKFIGLQGHDQAMALAYQFAAHRAASTHHSQVKVRARPYEFRYDIKARAWTEEEILASLDKDKTCSPSD